MTDTDPIFGTLRDIADNEPIETLYGYSHDEIGARCTMCGSEVLTPFEEAMDRKAKGLPLPPRVPAALRRRHTVPPVPHLDSCPWKRTTLIVGLP